MYSLKVAVILIALSNSPNMILPTMHPSEFCRKWVPRFRDYREGEKRFRWECGTIIMTLTGYARSSVYGWLSGTAPAPIHVQKALGFLDLLLEADEAVLMNFCQNLQEFLSDMDTDNGHEPD